MSKDLRKKDKEICELSYKFQASEGLGKRLAEETATVKVLKAKLKSAQTLKCRYKKHVDEVQNNVANLKGLLDSEAEDENVNFRTDGRGRRFTDDVRLCYMALQGDTTVSADNCLKVVQIVSKHLFKKDISDKDLPKSTSAINFQNEAHVLAKYHTAQEIKDCQHFTYACDGTSRDKKHYLEQHLVLDNGKVLSLGFQEIVSDDSDTILEKCTEFFRELCKYYHDDSDSHDGDYDEDVLLKEIIRKMKCIISDRASVMKCFDAKMADFKVKLLDGEDCSTHFLSCNAHFLLGLSNAVEESIKLIEGAEETKNGEKLGRDALPQFAQFSHCSETAALQIIRTASEVFGPRGDEKNGCRNEWLAFCSVSGIKSQFSSFRSNRFNNVFQNATALLFHKDDIQQFLSRFVSHNNLKLQSIVSDLKDARIISIISAMSLFHVFFTDPYWQLVNSNKRYEDFPRYVRKMESFLQLWKGGDFTIESLESVFDDFVHDHSLNFDLMCDIDKVKYNMSVMAERCLVVLKRQLVDFIEGGVFGGSIEKDVMDVLMTCPLTNLAGERLFGDMDYDMNRRRHVSLHLRSTNVMWKRNRTSAWLRKLSIRKQKMLLAKAIHSGPKWKMQSREKQLLVLERVKKKIADNKDQKLRKEVKISQKKTSIMDQVISYGNVCSTKDDVDRLMLEPRAVENIKAQINYRKVCLGENVQVTGSLSVLYKRLVEHLGFSVEDSVPVGKSRKRMKIA